MKAAKLYGPRDFRMADVPEPPAPGSEEVTVQIGAVGVCGSDLHSYLDGRIGDTVIQSPIVLGHEFAGTVIAAGAHARDGLDQPLAVGQRVAIDPSMPCWHCDRCEEGDPNLCRHLSFMGLYPDDGALQECMTVPARGCFPLPDALSLEEGALLEPLGVALYAVGLGNLRLAKSVAVLGCGPIGLLILRLAKLSGAAPLFALDQYAWRLDQARAWGANEVIDIRAEDPVQAILARTGGRGVETVFEAAWAGAAVDQAVQMADLGGHVVMVGIPSEDHATFTHSVARRKGLTFALCRRMKHTYPRTIALATSGSVPLTELITHHFPLEKTGDAFALNTAYQDGIIKAVITL